MPNKTIYVRESDLPLWESAQAELGESISSLFAQFLRERMQKVDTFVHVLRTEPQQSKDKGNFAVMLAPVGPTGTGGSMKPHYVSGRDQLIRLLSEVGLPQEAIRKIESDLKRQGSVSVRAILPRPGTSRMRTEAWIGEKSGTIDTTVKPSYFLDRVRDISATDVEFRLLHAPGGDIDRRPSSLVTESDLQMTRWYKEPDKYSFFLAGSTKPWSIKRSLKDNISGGVYIVLRSE